LVVAVVSLVGAQAELSRFLKRHEHGWIAAEDDSGYSDVASTEGATTQVHEYAAFDEGSFKGIHKEARRQPSPRMPRSIEISDQHALIEGEHNTRANDASTSQAQDALDFNAPIASNDTV
jgi:hypothetical protein